jgi:hypothetical protein
MLSVQAVTLGAVLPTLGDKRPRYCDVGMRRLIAFSVHAPDNAENFPARQPRGERVAPSAPLRKAAPSRSLQQSIAPL